MRAKFPENRTETVGVAADTNRPYYKLLWLQASSGAKKLV